MREVIELGVVVGFELEVFYVVLNPFIASGNGQLGTILVRWLVPRAVVYRDSLGTGVFPDSAFKVVPASLKGLSLRHGSFLSGGR